jgi:LPS sulfotransferase NodH
MKATVNGVVVEGTVEEIAALMALSLPAKTEAQTKRDEATAKHNEVMAHVHDRRIVRRETTDLGGLTKAERSALWAAHPELHPAKGEAKTAAQIAGWASVVEAYKAATK